MIVLKIYFANVSNFLPSPQGKWPILLSTQWWVKHVLPSISCCSSIPLQYFINPPLYPVDWQYSLSTKCGCLLCFELFKEQIKTNTIVAVVLGDSVHMIIFLNLHTNTFLQTWRVTFHLFLSSAKMGIKVKWC